MNLQYMVSPMTVVSVHVHAVYIVGACDWLLADRLLLPSVYV